MNGRTVMIAFILMAVLTFPTAAVNGPVTAKVQVGAVNETSVIQNTRNDKSLNDGDWLATVDTSMGQFTIKLYPEQAPITVANFMTYVNESFYDGLIFHRVIDGFVVQGGGFYPGLIPKSPTHPPIPLEPTNVTGLHHADGAVGMARTSDPNSATTQFYICDGEQGFLDAENRTDGGYAVFGQVVDGMEVIRAISAVPTTTYGTYNDVPKQNITINTITLYKYRVNSPPVFTGSIPEVTLHEDMGDGIGALNLSDYFSDDTGAESLKYYPIVLSSAQHISVEVNGTMLNIEQKQENWFGTATMKVKAVDVGLDGIEDTDDDYTVESNTFTVRVLPTNDPPVVSRIEGLPYDGGVWDIELYQREWYNFTVEGEDIDGDTVTFSSNLSGVMPGFSISAQGEVSIHGLQANVGEWMGTINASDGNGSFGLAYIDILVRNRNDPPVVKFVGGLPVEGGTVSLTGDAALEEDTTATITVSAWDPDGNDMTLELDNWTGLAEIKKTSPGNWTMNLTPSQENVGTDTVFISVSDSNAITRVAVVLEVLNRNDPPVLAGVSSEDIKFLTWDSGSIELTFKEDTPVTVTVSVEDQDGDDISLSFWNTTGVADVEANITAGGAILSITPAEDLNGDHNITMLISDGTATTTVTIEMHIEPVNDPPRAIIEDKGNGTIILQEGQELVLHGSATDDSPILTYEWYSDRSGRIATGMNLTTLLSPGTYNITLRVSDDDGLRGEDYVDVVVMGNSQGGKKEEEGAGEAGASTGTYIAIVIAVVVVLIVVAVLFMRRKKGVVAEDKSVSEGQPKTPYAESTQQDDQEGDYMGDLFDLEPPAR